MKGNERDHPEFREYDSEEEFNAERDVRKHSIKGWFTTKSWNKSGQSTFHGTFTEAGRGAIVGHLVDLFGESDIEGELQEGRLIFSKTYHGGEYGDANIKFQYRAIGNGQWGGKYHLVSSHGAYEGNSACKTELLKKKQDDDISEYEQNE